MDSYTRGALAAVSGLPAAVVKYGLSDEDRAKAISAASAKLNEANSRIVSGSIDAEDARFCAGQARILSVFLNMVDEDPRGTLPPLPSRSDTTLPSHSCNKSNQATTAVRLLHVRFAANG